MVFCIVNYSCTLYRMFKVSSVQLEIDFIAYPVTYRYLKNSQTKVRFSHTGKLYIKYLKTFTMEKMKYFAPYADVSPSMTFVKGCERDRQTDCLNRGLEKYSLYKMSPRGIKIFYSITFSI